MDKSFHGPEAGRNKLISCFACVLTAILFSFACGSKPVEPRSLAPADSVIYLESADLKKTFGALTESKAFQSAAQTPDLSALDGVRAAVAVTGFEASTRDLTEESAVLSFRPLFAAILETNAWNWQAISFTENRLGDFINQTYGGGVSVEVSQRPEGRYFAWTAEDGRKAFALVDGSLVIFGNDESAIEKCLAVRRLEAESIARNLKVPAAGENTLAVGYISADGIAQIANLAGVSMAKEAGDDEDVQSFIARVLPELVRNSVTELTWTSERSDQGIEDRFTITADPEVGPVLSETLSPASGRSAAFDFVPADVFSATRYSLKVPQIAWRSVVLVARDRTDQLSGGIIAEFSNKLLEPYGVADPETFLSAVDSEILIARFDAEGESQAVIAQIKDADKVRSSVSKDISFAKPPIVESDAEVWRSEDGSVAAAISGDKLVIGESGAVTKCLASRSTGGISKDPRFTSFVQSNAVAVTAGREPEVAGKIAEVFGAEVRTGTPVPAFYVTETRYNSRGVERRTVSDFGFIGWIIEKLARDE